MFPCQQLISQVNLLMHHLEVDFREERFCDRFCLLQLGKAKNKCVWGSNFFKCVRKIRLPLYLIETPLNAFENRADPDKGLLCLLIEI